MKKIAADGVDGVKCPNVCPVPCGLGIITFIQVKQLFFLP